MTPGQLAAIRARADQATPGPWRDCVWDPMERPHVHKDVEGERFCRPPDLPLSRFDAEFIAHARADIPDLLAALEAAQRERGDVMRQAEALEREVSDLRAHCDEVFKSEQALAAEVVDLRAKVAELRGMLHECREMLRGLEFEGCDRYATPACPVCRAIAPDNEAQRDDGWLHRDGCTLAPLLAKLGTL